MKHYIKRDAALDLGAGWCAIEYDDEEPTRQVERYGDRWFSSRRDYHPELGPGLTDLSWSESEFEPEDEVSAAEFEELWREAGKHELGP